VIIAGGLVALPGLDTPVRADITIANGVISRVALPTEPRETEIGEVVDAQGLLVLPGAIDPHVHFDDPGYTDREDFSHGTAAAASGGVTTVIDMASTSVPPVTSAANLQTKLKAVAPKALIDFGFFGGVSGQVYEAGASQVMEELAPDVMGFKCYFVSGMETFASLNYFQFLQVLKIAAGLMRPVLVHAEDASVVGGATADALAAGGINPTDYYHSRPESAEILAVLAAVELAAVAWGHEHPPEPPVHIVHVSTGRAADIIGDSPYLSGETGPQYLAFTLDDFQTIGSALKVTPPPKPGPNNEILWAALETGKLGFVASDHAPAPDVQKSTGSIWTDYAGIPGTGTLLPYLFSEGYSTGRLSLSRFVELTSAGAARRYGLDHRKGGLRVGSDGDIVLIDPTAEWVVRGSEFLSKGKITPFEGMKLTGKVVKTIVRGCTVYDADAGIIGKAGAGEFLRRESR
jgi:dihydroorotase (multifunctional complex type)